VVTLFGSVDSEQDKATAEAEAMKVAGVKRVENELQVVPDVAAGEVERRDEQILEAVEKALAQRDLEGAEIDAEVANGVVRLSGTIQSQSQRMAALTTARSVEGVDSVVDSLRLERSSAQAPRSES
jgi:osmotically-inducible protein OsmY